MRTHAFGRDGPSVGVIGQGTWQLERDRRRAVQALRCGVELGLRHVDSAEIYGDGEVERLVGEALQGLVDGGADAVLTAEQDDLPVQEVRFDRPGAAGQRLPG